MTAVKLGPYELNTTVLGDCIEVMRQIPDNSIDSIVTDSPYGLGNDPDMLEMLTHWLNDKDYDTGPGFMSRAWDVVPGPAVWRECYRVLKPGGCLMAFGGTRTCDLLSIAIRLAGFQRFDQIVWIHGQGFAKGADVSKNLDAMAGMEREVIGRVHPADKYDGSNRKDGHRFTGNTLNGGNYGQSRLATITAPATEAAALWEGWKSALKPAHEVILCFWKPREKSFAFNALKYGVSGLWIDGCRIATEDNLNGGAYSGNTSKLVKDVYGEYNKLKPKDYKQPSGRFPSNVLLSHHPACVRVGVKRVRGTGPTTSSPTVLGIINDDSWQPRPTEHLGYADPDGLESVPDYRCHPDCAVWQLDRQAGKRPVSGSAKNGRPAKGNNYDRNNTVYSPGLGSRQGRLHNDSGSASRFYYTPKAPPREKWFYCEICDDCYPYKEREDHAHGKPKGKRKHQVAHPTVKPLAICNFTLGVLEYLCRLTKTPTGGIVLDPFGGSGTTALAAIANGRPFLLIENDPVYHRIAQKRIEQAMKEPRQPSFL